MNSPKQIARLAGVFYLLVGIFGGFAEGFVEPSMYVEGDAAATVNKLVTNVDLVRIGIVADLVDQVFFVLLAITLYFLLKHVNQIVASVMVIFVALAAGITCLNTVFEMVGLRVATGAIELSSLGSAGSNALVLLLLDIQHYGILTAQIFFGLWLAPLGYLTYKSSGWFPKWIGILLITGTICYLLNVFTLFLVPNFGRMISSFVVIPSAFAEIVTLIYLLVVGVKIMRPNEVTRAE
jgi:hypothetical protein